MRNSKETMYESRFVILEFQDECQKEYELLPINLVPGKWVRKCKDNYLCKYPPKKDFEYVDTWIKEERSPERSWKSYKVAAIHGADDFAQVKRRLERAYASRECASTNCERPKSTVKHIPMSDSDLHQQLRMEMPVNVTLNTEQGVSIIDSFSQKPGSQRANSETIAPALSRDNRASSTARKSNSRVKQRRSDDSSDSNTSVHVPRSPNRPQKKSSGKGAMSRSATKLHSKSKLIETDSENSRSSGIDKTVKKAPKYVPSEGLTNKNLNRGETAAAVSSELSESDDENTNNSNSRRIGICQMNATKSVSPNSGRSNNKFKLDVAIIAKVG